MPGLPSGTVTFLFTDIEGSTALWERDRAVMQTAVDRHLVLLDAAIASHHGIHFKTVGDAVQAAFPTAPEAVAAALTAQRTLLSEPWPEVVGTMRVRMALHTTAATPQDGDYLTPGLNRLARLLAAGHGGQVLVSLATQDLARDALPSGASLRDLGEHPLRDLYRPERVFQLVHPGLPADFPPIRTLTTRPNNLPIQPTPFLGREEQVGQIVAFLRRDEVRLLTITGPGGVGKTRLALQAAADLLENFPDGVWFVDLSALSDPGLVPAAMLTALGSREASGPVEDRLASVLADKHTLLVLDNFERLVDAAPLVANVLARTAALKVLVTSRTPLHVYGEREYPLAPLPLPDATRLLSLEHLSQYEAVRLFIERAQAVKPDFAVTNANAPAVAEICSRLDGLPLAIELAAALVKVLPPQALLKRLQKRLPLLTGGARTLPARQQTMRDAIAWGHDLLTEDQQTVFRRLAVFAGGCTIEAAEAVVAHEGTPDVFDGITALVDKSLLRQEEGLAGEPRFRMLETVREYGLERLEAGGEGGGIRERHATYFTGVASQGLTGLKGPDEIPWGAALDAEHDNFRAALEWALGHNPGRAWDLAGALAYFWYLFGYFMEGRRSLDRVLALPQPDPPSLAYVDVVGWAGMLAHYQGDYAQATPLIERELSAARAVGDAARIAEALTSSGIVAEDSGVYDDAQAFLEEAAEIQRRLGDRYDQALTLAHLGIVAYGQGELERAEAQCVAARTLAQEVGNLTAQFMAPLTLGHIAIETGDLRQAADWYREVLTLFEGIGGFASALERGDREGVARTLAAVALLAAEKGEGLRAARLFGMAEAARAPLGLVLALPESAAYERGAAAARVQIGEAAFMQAFDEGRSASGEQMLVEVETELMNAVTTSG